MKKIPKSIAKNIVLYKRAGGTKVSYQEVADAFHCTVEDVRTVLENEIINLKEANASSAAIAKETGCSAQTVHNVLKKHGLTSTRPNRPQDVDRPERDQLICKLSQEGCNTREIRLAVGEKWQKWENISNSTVERILHENGIYPPRSNARVFDPLDEKIFSLKQKGMKTSAIADKLGIPKERVIQFAKRHPKEAKLANTNWNSKKEQLRAKYLKKYPDKGRKSMEKRKQLILSYMEEGITTTDMAYILGVSTTYCDNLKRKQNNL